jgi:hypothetical protein
MRRYRPGAIRRSTYDELRAAVRAGRALVPLPANGTNTAPTQSRIDALKLAVEVAIRRPNPTGDDVIDLADRFVKWLR